MNLRLYQPVRICPSTTGRIAGGMIGRRKVSRQDAKTIPLLFHFASSRLGVSRCPLCADSTVIDAPVLRRRPSAIPSRSLLPRISPHFSYGKMNSYIETSDDPYAVELIQAHGGVVSLFVKNGFAEAWKNHEVPGAKGGAAAADGLTAGAVGCPRAGCPLAAAGQCPRAAAGQCPAGKNCPLAAAGQCPAGKNCPLAQSCPAGKDCPYAKACPAGKDCPQAQQCPAGKACLGCPNAGTCPLNKTEPAPPLPKTSEK